MRADKQPCAPCFNPRMPLSSNLFFMKYIMRNLGFATVLGLILSFAGLSPAAWAAERLVPVAKSILLPNRDVATDCNLSSVSITLGSKSRFVIGNKVKVSSSIENGPVAVNQAPQSSGQPGFQIVSNSPGSTLGQASIFLNVQLCSAELPPTDPTYLWVYLDLQSSAGASKATAKVKMPI